MTIPLRSAARSGFDLVCQSSQGSGYAGPRLYLLCDRMGGLAGGNVASAAAVEHLVPLNADSRQASELLGPIRDAIRATHTELAAPPSWDPDLAGLGTTYIGVVRSGNKLVMIHVGDSHTYVLRGDTLTQVTVDHTFVEYPMKAGRLTRGQACQHPQRSVLLRVLGDTEGEIQLDESIREAVPGDRWLLRSDSLSGLMTARIIGEVLTGVADPGQATSQFTDLALRAGGPGNVTTAVFDVVEGNSEPQTMPQVVGSAAIEHLAQERATITYRVGDEQVETEDTETISPVAKAATLMATLEDKPGAISAKGSSEVDETIATEAAIQKKARHRHRCQVLVGSLVLLTALVGASALLHRWTQTRYCVPTYKGEVIIYQGVPQFVGPLKLSHSVKTYVNLPVGSLDHNIHERLETTATQSSVGITEVYVNKTVCSYHKQAPTSQGTIDLTAKPSPSSSPTPSPVSIIPTQPTKPGQEE